MVLDTSVTRGRELLESSMEKDKKIDEFDRWANRLQKNSLITLIGMIMIVVSLTLLLNACSELRVRGADYYDESLAAAKRFECNHTSVGSIVREYGDSEERFNAWMQHCFGDQALPFDASLMKNTA